MEKLISVIVPMYQAEKTIKRCLDSICRSEYENLEIIVVDDGSTDRSAEIVTALAKKDTRLKLIKIAGGGVSHARNTGLSAVHGEYIGFVDADDFIHPKMYTEMAAAMTQDCDMVICGCYHCDSEGTVTDANAKKINAYTRQCPEDALKTVIYEHTTMAVWSKLFRRNRLFTEEGNLRVSFPEQLSNYEDFNFVCAYLSGCTGCIRRITGRLYYYTAGENTLSGRELSAKEIRNGLLPLVKLAQKQGMKENPAKLLYTETFVIHWYTQILKHPEYRTMQNLPDGRLVQHEAARFLKRYLKAEEPSLFRKLAAWMMAKHERIAFFCASACTLLSTVNTNNSR